MRKLCLVGLGFAGLLAAPAAALEHEVTIDHAAGLIAADYRGSVTIQTQQVGTAGVAGRPSTLRCNWTATLNVERVASVGDRLRSQRSLRRDDVARGSRPGWCETQATAIAKLVDTRSGTFRRALLALVEADRAEILAEADSAARSDRG